MSIHTNPLDNLKVAAPCSADWGRMRGDERVRFCGSCSLNVYNLSGMTRAEAETLIVNKEGRLCVRFYRRADGTILTNNCPVGLRALKRRVSRLASAVASAVIGFMTGLGLNVAFGEKEKAQPTDGFQIMGAMIAAEARPGAGGDLSRIAFGEDSKGANGHWEKGEALTVTTGEALIEVRGRAGFESESPAAGNSKSAKRRAAK